MPYRIRDVAQQAGVSKSTVSRVFNRSNLVDTETRRRVLEIARKLDYHPNASAKQLARGGRIPHPESGQRAGHCLAGSSWTAVRWTGRSAFLFALGHWVPWTVAGALVESRRALEQRWR